MKSVLPVLLCFFLASCNPMLFADAPIDHVDVDGYIIDVQRMPRTQDSYGAAEHGSMDASINPRAYARNVKAIEISTGCKVLAGSVVNQGNLTLAAVECSKRR